MDGAGDGADAAADSDVVGVAAVVVGGGDAACVVAADSTDGDLGRCAADWNDAQCAEQDECADRAAGTGTGA